MLPHGREGADLALSLTQARCVSVLAESEVDHRPTGLTSTPVLAPGQYSYCGQGLDAVARPQADLGHHERLAGAHTTCMQCRVPSPVSRRL